MLVGLMSVTGALDPSDGGMKQSSTLFLMTKASVFSLLLRGLSLPEKPVLLLSEGVGGREPHLLEVDMSN